MNFAEYVEELMGQEIKPLTRETFPELDANVRKAFPDGSKILTSLKKHYEGPVHNQYIGRWQFHIGKIEGLMSWTKGIPHFIINPNGYNGEVIWAEPGYPMWRFAAHPQKGLYLLTDIVEGNKQPIEKLFLIHSDRLEASIDSGYKLDQEEFRLTIQAHKQLGDKFRTIPFSTILEMIVDQQAYSNSASTNNPGPGLIAQMKLAHPILLELGYKKIEEDKTYILEK
jgi:hypothetical protein